MCCLVVQVVFDLFCLTEMRLNLLEVLTTLSISFFGGEQRIVGMMHFFTQCRTV